MRRENIRKIINVYMRVTGYLASTTACVCECNAAAATTTMTAWRASNMHACELSKNSGWLVGGNILYQNCFVMRRVVVHTKYMCIEFIIICTTNSARSVVWAFVLLLLPHRYIRRVGGRRDFLCVYSENWCVCFVRSRVYVLYIDIIHTHT